MTDDITHATLISDTVPAADTIPADAGTSTDALTLAEPVVIPGTAATPPVSISVDEHQLIADLKASGHDLTVLFKDFVGKL